MFISITRLRIRTLRFVPLFAFHTLRSLRQVRRSRGFQQGSVLPDRNWTFWTMTACDNEPSIRAYMTNGSHHAAMPHLMHWCDEASVVHWEQDETALPSWTEADRRMRQDGRISKVRFPSSTHDMQNYRAPRVSGAGPIRAAHR